MTGRMYVLHRNVAASTVQQHLASELWSDRDVQWQEQKIKTVLLVTESHAILDMLL